MTKSETIILDEIVPATRPWSGIMRAGQVLRLEDSGGCQAVDTLFYSATDTGERYSAQDTMMEQGSAYISIGTEILSNRGNVMLEVIADSCGLPTPAPARARVNPTPCASATKPGTSTPVARIPR